jgi:ATP-dependent RNA helicase RhlB
MKDTNLHENEPNTPSSTILTSEPTEIAQFNEIESFEELDETSSEKQLPIKKTITSFSEAKLEPDLMKALDSMGWKAPTVIQSTCLPFTLNQRDVAGFAQTGTGKTGVFLITIAQMILKNRRQRKKENKHPSTLIICPTRELAIQIEEDAQKMFAVLSIKILAIFGGGSWEQQGQDISKGVDIIVATPGRLKDFESSGILRLDHVELFVCDEVDRMFEMGFIDDVEFCLKKIREDAQKLLFSATTNDRVKELAFEYLNYPEYIFINSDEVAPEAIEQHAIICETSEKFKILLGLIQRHQPERCIIFTNTKIVASWLKVKIEKNNFETDVITGDLTQSKRIRLIEKIKSGKIKILIATDVASRGLHITGVTHIYNFDIPDDPANYIHRIGRTARAGESGKSYSLVCDEYGENYLDVQKLLGVFAPVPKWYDAELATTEDKSGNPFDDPEFNQMTSRDSQDFGRPRNFKSDRFDTRTNSSNSGGYKGNNSSSHSHHQNSNSSYGSASLRDSPQGKSVGGAASRGSQHHHEKRPYQDQDTHRPKRDYGTSDKNLQAHHSQGKTREQPRRDYTDYNKDSKFKRGSHSSSYQKNNPQHQVIRHGAKKESHHHRHTAETPKVGVWSVLKRVMNLFAKKK